MPSGGWHLAKGAIDKANPHRRISYGAPPPAAFVGLPAGTVIVDVTTGREYTNAGTAGTPSWQGPATLFAEDFATDPAARWTTLIGTWLPTGGAAGDGAYDLSGADNAPNLVGPGGLPGANTPTVTGIWSARFRLRLAELVAGDDPIFLALDTAASTPLYLTLGQNADGAALDAVLGLGWQDGLSNASMVPGSTTTLLDGGWHWVELLYNTTGAQPVGTATIDGTPLLTASDPSGPRAADTYPERLFVWGPPHGTLLIDRVTVADGYQGVG